MGSVTMESCLVGVFASQLGALTSPQSIKGTCLPCVTPS